MRIGNLPESATAQQTPWYENFLNTVASVAGQYLTLEQQKEFAEIQTERMRQGLPPLDVSQYAPGVQVGVSQSTERTILTVAAIGAAGAIAYALLSRPSRAR